MRIIRAEEMGMCFGVRNALAAAAAITTPETVTIHGELVHNEEVNAALARRGFRVAREARRRALPPTRQVLITAHGLSDRERRRLDAAGKQLIDTTCPLVQYAHRAARELQRRGCFVVIVGRPGHVEVEGLRGDLGPHAVVEGPAAARRFPARRLGIVFQTTTEPEHADRTTAAIAAANPTAEVRVADTICGPTRNRQQALELLLAKVEALVVVGGRRSNNTRALAERARCRGVPALHVQGPVALPRAWFAPYEVVGLSAGTSTPTATIDAVEQALRAL